MKLNDYKTKVIVIGADSKNTKLNVDLKLRKQKTIVVVVYEYNAVRITMKKRIWVKDCCGRKARTFLCP